MDKFEQYFKQLDDFAESMPELVKVCKDKGIRPGHVLAAAGVVVIVVGTIMKGYDIVCALLTCVYPMIYSIRAIESHDDQDDKQWLCFWTVFGLFQTLELFFGFILSFIPYYSIIRLIFFVFLMHPSTGGALILYEKFFKPYLDAHKTEIEEFIEKVKAGASELQKEAISGAKKAASDLNTPENMAKAMGAAAQAQQMAQEAQKME